MDSSFFLLALVTFSLAGRAAASWCACKPSADTKALQAAIDFACGHGADCNPIHVNQACYAPNTVVSHCNYAVNSYYQKNSQQSTACDFSGAAGVVATDPSGNGCQYPSTASSSSSTPTTPTGSSSGSGSGTGSSSGGGTSTGTGSGSGMGTPSTMPNGSPLVTTPSTGNSIMGGGTPPGTLGPSGLDTDMSRGGVRLPTRFLVGSSVVIAFSALVFS